MILKINWDDGCLHFAQIECDLLDDEICPLDWVIICSQKLLDDWLLSPTMWIISKIEELSHTKSSPFRFSLWLID